MSSDKTPLELAVDQAMDAFVYAPIGLIFDGPALFPKLVQHGRNQVQVARMMGEMAVQMGQSELTKRASATSGPMRDVLAGFGLVDGAAPNAEPAPDTASDEPASTTPTTKKSPTKKASTKKAPKKKASTSSTTKRARSSSGPAADTLGIPDYDSLSASQVVQRLRGLVPDDLDAVKAYESANRARKTVLNKIAQLQAKD